MVHVTMKNRLKSSLHTTHQFSKKYPNYPTFYIYVPEISVKLFLYPLFLILPDFLLFSRSKVLHKLDQPPVKEIFSKYLKEWKNISNACITYLWNISISSLATLPTNSARGEKLNAGGSRRECPS